MHSLPQFGGTLEIFSPFVTNLSIIIVLKIKLLTSQVRMLIREGIVVQLLVEVEREGSVTARGVGRGARPGGGGRRGGRCPRLLFLYIII